MPRLCKCFSILGLAWIVAPAMTLAGLFDASGQPDPTDQGNSMLLWLRADQGFSPSLWADQSTHGFDATQADPASQPSLDATGLGGGAVALFDGDDFMGFGTGPTAHQTTLIVYQDTSTQSWVTPLGTTYLGGGPADDAGGSYHGNSDAAALFNPVHTDARTVNGRNFRNGVDVGNGLSTPRPSDYALDIHVATGPLQQVVSFLGSDSCCGDPPAGRAINGGIAEVILYDRALDISELNEMQNYLANRYSLSVAEIEEPPPPEMPIDGNAISLNFATGQDASSSYDMTPDMVAGVVRTDSWTNLHMAAGSENNLMGNRGQPTGASVEWNANGTWETAISPFDGDTTMMKSHLDARASGFDPPEDATVTVSNLPSSYTENGYDVYVYFDATTANGSVFSGYTIADQTYWINDTSTFDGSTYAQATGTTKDAATQGANYALFSGLTTPSFELVADSDEFRAEVSGIQIVEIPEPSTLPLMLIATCGWGCWRRRKLHV